MKPLAFLWWENEVKFDRDKPFDKQWKCEDYAEYTEMLRDRDVDVVCGEYRWYEDGRMRKAFRWNGNEWEKVENVEIDGVYDLFRHDKEKHELKQEMKSEVGILNDPEVADLCQDKLKTFREFGEYMPETLKASKDNVEEMLEDYGKAIIKPRYGSSGEGIHVIDSLTDYDVEDPESVLVQRFIEDAGIPELHVEGPHDLRILVVNDDVVGSYLRIPGEDSVLSNVAQGGSKNYIELSKVPESAMERVQEVAEELESYRPVIYTVDFMMAGGTPYIVELNSQPGVYYHGPGRSKEWERPWMKKMVDAIEELAKD
ncbi:MAG: RimK family alpha-L-glutamate ligase [Candidatus Nanohalobium sp.]